MKIRIEANLKRNDDAPATPPWWTRTIAVPMMAIVATLLLTAVLAGSVLILILHPSSEIDTGPQAPPSATFLRTDTVTQGSWKTVYGSGGYAIADDSDKFPKFAHVGLPDKPHSTFWVDQVDEPRALQKANGTKRIAGTWFAWGPFTIDVDLTDSRTHRLALYVIDWDSVTRVENIEILDGIDRRLLDARQVSKFNGGQYLIWKTSGHTIIRITPVAGANAVASGVFLD
jgi:hypothetical protein